MLTSLFDDILTQRPVLIRKDGLSETRIAASIMDIGREDWNACFENEVEDFDYLLAVEEAGIENFQWRYVTVMEEGRVLAAMPAFLTEYQLETTVENGRLSKLIRNTRQYFPRFLTLRLACLGSPCTENGQPGFHPSISPDGQAALFAKMLEGFEQMAAVEGCSLLGVKDIPETLAPKLLSVIENARYTGMAGLATAYLDINFQSVDQYMQRLSSGTRKDMKRKLKVRAEVEMEEKTDFSDVLPRVMELYNGTRERSDWQFEALTTDYFTGVLQKMPGRSFCTLYKVSGEILAANIFVHNNDVLIDKFFCMEPDKGKSYNLYYLSWVYNIEYCLRHGIGRYQSGQAYYENKVRLGSQLTQNTMFFRHRNLFVNTILRIVSPWFAIDEKSEKQ